MKAEPQLKNDEYNIFEFIKYVSDIENNKNIIAFMKQEYSKEKVNEIIQTGIEYHEMFNNYKFNVWIMANKNKLKKSIIFVSIDKLDTLAKKNINKLRKYSEQIIVEFDQNITIEEAKQYAITINENIIVGYTNYAEPKLRKVIMLLGKKFEYKSTKNNLKILAIMHTFNEEDIIETTIKYLLEQNVDVCILDNWSTDNTYQIIQNLKSEYPERIILERFPEKEPEEKYYEWEKQLHKTEEISKKLDYDWYIHYDADEIRKTPYNNVTIADMINFVDSLGYNAINTTVLDFRLTNKDDNIFDKDTYFEIGRKPSHFEQIKTWKKCDDIDLASSGGHLAKFQNQKVYPIKIINRHYPLRSIEQAEKKIFKDRLPRFEKEKKEKGWHSQYDKIAQEKDFIYEKQNLNKYEKDTIEHLTLELIAGIGINKL